MKRCLILYCEGPGVLPDGLFFRFFVCMLWCTRLSAVVQAGVSLAGGCAGLRFVGMNKSPFLLLLFGVAPNLHYLCTDN